MPCKHGGGPCEGTKNVLYTCCGQDEGSTMLGEDLHMNNCGLGEHGDERAYGKRK